jgi:hypothetical protein
VDVAALAQGIEAFCQRVRPTLAPLTFAQRRQLVALLIDRVIGTDGQVEIRYVVPTGPKGETTPFCHLRLDYFDLEACFIIAVDRLGRQRHVRAKAQGIASRVEMVHQSLRYIFRQRYKDEATRAKWRRFKKFYHSIPRNQRGYGNNVPHEEISV